MLISILCYQRKVFVGMEMFSTCIYIQNKFGMVRVSASQSGNAVVICRAGCNLKFELFSTESSTDQYIRGLL